MKDEIITGVLGPFLAIDVGIAINCEVSSSNNASFAGQPFLNRQVTPTSRLCLGCRGVRGRFSLQQRQHFLD